MQTDLTLNPDYAPFLSDTFDSNSYSNKLLASPDADVSGALAKLNGGIDEVNRQLRNEITSHHAELLSQAAAITTLDDSLSKIRSGLSEVDGGVERLRRKIAIPHQELAASLQRLDRLQKASDLAKRASRLIQLARRLDAQMSELSSSNSTKENEYQDRILAEAALTLSEIENLRQEAESVSGDEATPLRAITALESHLDTIDISRERVITRMEDMIRTGLSTLNQQMLASSLQTAANLNILPDIVQSLVLDLTEAIEGRIKATFDMASLAREMSQKEGPTNSYIYKSRSRTEPTNVTLPQWASVLWTRLGALFQDMADCCIKVYTLEKVLELKRDTLSQASFLAICLKTLERKPSLIYWTTLASTFESQAKYLSKSSSFAQQVLGQAYPRLLRLFHGFFAKIAIHTDTVYTHTQQSPETVLLLRAVLPFENLYLTRSNSRLNEAVGAALQGGTRSPPGANEGLAASRAMCNELDSARFDPLLVRSVARNVARSMEFFVSKVENLIASDYSATSLVGPLSTPSQALNAEITNALYHFWQPIQRTIENDYPQVSSVPDIISPPLKRVRSALFSIVGPLLGAIRREFSNILARIHRVNFEKAPAAANGMGEAGGSSPYMKDLGDKLVYVRGDILGPLRVGNMSKDWATDLARFLIRDFMLHASIITPLSEAGKLKLVSDLTSLEFHVSQLLSDHKLSMVSLGHDFTSLRAFRPLLFLETAELSDPKQTSNVPLLPLLHHIIVRSKLSLPHRLHGWSEAEYVKWINEHDEAGSVQLIQGTITDWEETHGTEEEAEYVSLLRTVIANRTSS